MGLDILELGIHDRFDIWRRSHVLAEQGRVILIRVSLDLPNYASAFRNVSLELTARLDSVNNIHDASCKVKLTC